MAVTGRGLIGTGSATTAGTTITVTNTTGAIIPAGTFIHITGAWDNINSVTAPTITSSTVGGVAPTANHATAIGSGVTTTAGSGVWHQCFRVLTTGTIASGATIATLTSNQSAVKRAGHAEGFNNCTATLRGTVTTGTSAAGTPSVTTTGTALVIGDLAIGSISNENNGQATADADTTGGAWPPIVGIATSGGGAAANVNSGSQYKVLTATGTQTFNPTCPAADAVVCVYSLVPVPDPTFTQAAYRLYADGTETGATALAAQDTSYEADVSGGDVNLAVRVRLQSTNAGSQAATDDYQLQYARNGGGWVDVSSSGPVSLDDSWGNWSGTTFMGAGDSFDALGESFIATTAGKLTTAEFWMQKLAAPPGTVTAKLYAHTGTFGTTSGLPTGTALATATARTASTLSTTATWEPFTFDGTYALVIGTAYVIAAEYIVGDVNNDVSCRFDSSLSPIHAGRRVRRTTSSGVWSTDSDPKYATCFRVYTTGDPTTVGPYASANLTDSAATTNRLGAGSGSFSAGEVSEDGLVDDLSWTANNYTELLYSITLKQADLDDADTLTFRVVRNGLTTGFTYTATPTVTIQIGAANIAGTALISASAATTVTGVPTTFGTAAISAAATVTVVGAPVKSGTALVSATVATTVVGTKTVSGTAAIGLTATVGAAGGAPVVPGGVILLESGDGQLLESGDERLLESGALVSVVTGTAALTASVAVTVAGTVVAEIVTGTALISASAVTTVVGKRTVRGTVAVSEAVAVTASGTPSVPGTALVTSTATITVVGKRTVRGVVAITEAASVTASGTPSVPATVLLSTSATVTAVGRKTVYGTVARTESVTVTALGSTAGQSVGTALVSSTATITAVGKRTVAGTAAIASSVAVAVVGRRVVRGTTAITAAATVTVTATPTTFGTVAITEAATITVAGKRATFGTGAVNASASVVVAGTVTRVGGGTAVISSSATVTAVGRRTTYGTAAIAGQVAVVAVGAITSTTVYGTALVNASATATVVGRRTVLGVAVLTGSGTVTVGTATRTVYGIALVGVTVTVTGLVITYYDDTHPHTGTWALTYMATYALEYCATVDRRYTATYDGTMPSGTWDLDHTATWELV